jgi:hypothetical protein
MPLPMFNVHRKLILDGKRAQYAYNDASVSLKFKISDLTLLNLTDISFNKAFSTGSTHSQLS